MKLRFLEKSMILKIYQQETGSLFSPNQQRMSSIVTLEKGKKLLIFILFWMVVVVFFVIVRLTA